MTRTIFDRADVRAARFTEARIQAAVFLTTTNVDAAYDLESTIVVEEISYFDTLQFSWLNTYLSWERLRSIGRLPLFGASYAALVLIPIFFFGLDFYNQKVALIQAWAQQELSTGKANPLATLLLAKLHTEAIPSRSLAIWLAAICLGIASTTYSLCCLARVREFSSVQWRDELNLPAFHYAAYSWKRPLVRAITASFYIIGGLLAVWLIAEKMFDVLLFILQNE